MRKNESQTLATKTRIDAHGDVGILDEIELDAVTGGGKRADGSKGAVVKAGWNLAQNKKAA